MTEIQPMGFRAQVREMLSKEFITLVPVTERNITRFDATLTQLGRLSREEDGVLNMTLKPEETNKEWVMAAKGVWLFGAKESNFAVPEQVVGFVNVYAPEHMEKINRMLETHHKRPYDKGAVLELASYAKEYPTNVAKEMSATKQALAKVFMDDQFKDVRAVSVWVTHEAGNILDPMQAQELTKLGAMKLDALKYDPSESVDSTCFVIPRNAFFNTLLAPRT